MKKISEIAKQLDLHETTVRRWIMRGKLQAVRLPNGTLRVAQDELDRLLSVVTQDKK